MNLVYEEYGQTVLFKGTFENVVVVPLVESERKPRDDEIEMIKDFLEDR